MQGEESVSFEEYVEDRYNKIGKEKSKYKKQYSDMTVKEKDDCRRNVMQQLATRINFLLDKEFIDREGYCAVPMKISITEEDMLNSKYPDSLYRVETMEEDLAHIRQLKNNLERNIYPVGEDKEKKELYEWLIHRYVLKYNSYMQRNFLDFPVGKEKLFAKISSEERELFDLLLATLTSGFMKRKTKKWECIDVEHRVKIIDLLHCVTDSSNWENIEFDMEEVEKRLLLPEHYRVEKLMSFITGVITTERGCKLYYEDGTIRDLLSCAEGKLEKIYNILDKN